MTEPKRPVEINCWVTRDRKGYSLFMWSGVQPTWQGTCGWCGTVAMGELDENAIPNVPNRRGCWPARLVVEVEE